MGEVRCIGCARARRRGGGCAICAAAIAREAAALELRVVASAPLRHARAGLTAVWIASGLLAVFFLGTDRPLALGMGLLLVAVAACVLLVRMGEARVEIEDVATPPRALAATRLPRRM